MSETPPPQFAAEFDEAVIFFNEASTLGKAACNSIRERLELARDELIPFRFVPTSKDSKDTEKTFQDEVDPERLTIIGFAGGDGTARQLVQPLQESEAFNSYENIALWAAGGGSGGNLLKTTIRKEDRQYPDNVLYTGKVEAFSPIRCSITTPDGNEYALSAATILGFGATHHMIAGINHESHRARNIRNFRIGQTAVGKYLVDPVELLSGLVHAPTFEIEEADGTTTSAVEQLFINAPRIAEVVYAPEVSLTGPVHSITIPRKRDIPTTFVRLAVSHSPGEDLLQPHKFRTLEPLPFQIDGENSINGKLLILQPGSQVVVEQSKRPLRIVTTK